MSARPTSRRERDVAARDVARILRMIRPTFRSQGGDVRLVDLDDRSAVIRLSGACDGCPISFEESAGVIERIVRSRVPHLERLTVV